MALPKVFIDGSHGTTGLKIQDRLQARADLELIQVDAADRRDIEIRRAAMSDADLAILCLPDDAAIEAAAWAVESGTKVIDASTAHRVADDWAYGLPEMDSGQRDAIRSSSKVANPGCYATGVVLGVRPLIEDGLLSNDVPLVVHAVSGFSGGGKQMIERWEGATPQLPNLPFQSLYALESKHKHIPEMTAYRNPPSQRRAKRCRC
jgi:N-acetyl-gamma-glutamyl-phosphate reductase